MTTRPLILVATAFLASVAPQAQTGAARAGRKQAAPVAYDREAVLRDVGIAHGMLRGLQYADATTTAQFQATGTQYIAGQAFKPGGPWPAARLTKYRVWINYAVPGMRIDLERTNPDGPIQGGGGLPFSQPQRQILVVGATRAWNETMLPGGPATPAVGQERDRAAQIWMLPQGVVKAARMAGDMLVIGMEGRKMTLAFPLPAPASAYTEKVRLDERKLVEHVEVTVDNPMLGTTKLEADYSDYKDPDLSDIPFPFHIVQKLGGFPILDITVTNARMYNPYVVVPIPDNVEAAYAAPAPDPQSKVDIQKAGSGVWFLTGATHNSVAVEFNDYIALVESPDGENRAGAVFDALKKQFPNKKVRYVINSHHHFDHAAGLRHVVAEGATILTDRDNKPYYDRVLPSGGKKPRVEAVIDKRVLSDGTQTLELYKIRGSHHANTMLIAYLPKNKLLVEADMWTPPGQPDAQPLSSTAAAEPLNLLANLERLKLDVAQIAPLHGRMVPIAEFRRAIGQANDTN